MWCIRGIISEVSKNLNKSEQLDLIRGWLRVRERERQHRVVELAYLNYIKFILLGGLIGGYVRIKIGDVRHASGSLHNLLNFMH